MEILLFCTYIYDTIIKGSYRPGKLYDLMTYPVFRDEMGVYHD